MNKCTRYLARLGTQIDRELTINIELLLYSNLPEYPLPKPRSYTVRRRTRRSFLMSPADTSQWREQRYGVSFASRAAAICLLSGGWTMARAGPFLLNIKRKKVNIFVLVCLYLSKPRRKALLPGA